MEYTLELIKNNGCQRVYKPKSGIGTTKPAPNIKTHFYCVKI